MNIKYSRVIPVIVAVSTAIFGGAWLGLYSCGGYVWVKECIHGTIIATTLIGLFVSYFFRWRKQQTGYKQILLRSLLFILLVCGTYIVTESIFAAFYPDYPESFSEFLRRFLYALQYGPC